MGCPEISYERMCREVYRIMSDNPNVNVDIPFEEVLNKIKAYDRNPEFYFNSGIAAGNIICDISENEGNDAFNAACGGLYMFEDLLGLHKEDENE